MNHNILIVHYLNASIKKCNNTYCCVLIVDYKTERIFDKIRSWVDFRRLFLHWNGNGFENVFVRAGKEFEAVKNAHNFYNRTNNNKKTIIKLYCTRIDCRLKVIWNPIAIYHGLHYVSIAFYRCENVTVIRSTIIITIK